MAIKGIEFLPIVVIDFFLVEELGADPSWTHANVDKAKWFLGCRELKSWIKSFDMIFSNEVVVVSIRIEVELKLLLELKFRIDWSLSLVVSILEVNVFRHKVLSDIDAF